MNNFWLVFFFLISVGAIGIGIWAFYMDPGVPAPRRATRRAAANAVLVAHRRHAIYALAMIAAAFMLVVFFQWSPFGTFVVFVGGGLLILAIVFGRPGLTALAGLVALGLVGALACWIARTPVPSFNPCGIFSGHPCSAVSVQPAAVSAPTPSAQPPKVQPKARKAVATNSDCGCRSYDQINDDLVTRIAKGQ